MCGYLNGPDYFSLALEQVSLYVRKIALTCLFAISPLCAAAEPTAIEVRAFMEEKGGDAAVEKFFPCSAGENGFSGYKRVDSGDKAWVELGLRLLPYTQGCERVAMYDSVAMALPKSPEWSLLLVSAKNSRVACLPISIKEEDVSRWSTHLTNVERALAKVREPKLQEAKKLCMIEVTEKRKELRGRRGDMRPHQ